MTLLEIVPLSYMVFGIPYHPITMVLRGSITIKHGIISVMISTTTLLKLMSSVIDWDILDHQVSLELDY